MDNHYITLTFSMFDLSMAFNYEKADSSGSKKSAEEITAIVKTACANSPPAPFSLW